MKVKYYCGMFYGPCVWHDCDTYEPTTCDSSGQIEVDDDAFDIGCAEAVCPICSNILEQGMGHFDEEDKESRSGM